MARKKRVQFIEVEAPTVDEAIKKALKQLSLPREKVEIEILREGDKGLFGMEGAKPALIRVVRLD